MKKLVIILVSAFAFTVQALAQSDVAVQGKVASNEKAVLKNIQIDVRGVDKTFTIHEDGTFRINIPQGKHVIKFSATGHATKTIIIEIKENTILDVELEKIHNSKTSRA